MRRLLGGHAVRILLILALALPALVTDPAPAEAVGYDVRAAIINSAIAQLGKPYIYGDAGPSSFDCSGLVQYTYNAAGIYVPHQSGQIWSRVDTITIDRLEPGDLVFRTYLPDPSQEPTTGANIRHVAIYVGGGQVIEAPSAGKTVRYTAVSNFRFGGRLRRSYWPLSDSSYDPPALVRGDFTGDGKDDAVYFYGLGGTSQRTYVLPSSGSVFGPLQGWYSNSRWDWNRTKIAAGDVNRDGKMDLIALYDYGGDTVKLWAFISDGNSFHPVVWWSSATGGWPYARTRLLGGDFDGDGRGDAALVRDDGGNTTRIFVARSTGGAFGGPRLWWYSGTGHWDARASKLAVGDLTGDGKADISMLYDYGRGSSKLWVFKSTGSTLTLQLTPWYASTGWDWNKVKLTSADVNGDHKGDLVMLYDYGASTTKLWSFISSGNGLSAVKIYWASPAGAWNWERVKLGAGDFDHEGRNDLTALYDLGSGASKAWLFDSNSAGTLQRLGAAWSSGAGVLDWNRVK